MITPGVLLIKRDALRPRCFEVEPGSHLNGWIPVQHTLTPRELEKELSATGWTFFYMAGTIRETAFGFNREKTVRTALNRCIKAVNQQRCNCLQIESVEMHSFLGIPYVSLSVQPRHIQKGTLFDGSSVRDQASIPSHELRRNVAA